METVGLPEEWRATLPTGVLAYIQALEARVAE